MDYHFHPDLENKARYLRYWHLRLNRFNVNMMNAALRVMVSFRHKAKDIQIRKHVISGYENTPLSVISFRSKNLIGKTPVILFFHGGGFMLKGGAHAYRLCEIYARETGCTVLFVDYHVWPKYPLPHAFEDTYLALEWANAKHDELEIDPTKIIITGDSAGGYLCANLSRLTKERQGPSILFQLLVYPALAPYADTESMRRFIDTPVWNARLSKRMQTLYFGPDTAPYDLLEKPLEGLPQTYVEAHEYDCLRDEALLYADRLEAAGVKAQKVLVQGSFHGADIFMRTTLVKDLIRARIEAIKAVI